MRQHLVSTECQTSYNGQHTRPAKCEFGRPAAFDARSVPEDISDASSDKRILCCNGVVVSLFIGGSACRVNASLSPCSSVTHTGPESHIRLTNRAYLAWFCLAYEGQRQFGLALTASAYAVCEVVFAIYMGYIIRQVQKPSLSSVSSSNRRQELLRKIINVDVAADPRGDTEACTLGRLGEVFSRHARQDGAEAMTAVQERPSPKRKAQQKDLLSDKKLKRDIEVQVDEGLSASADTTEQLHH